MTKENAAQALKRTPLYALHQELGAKLVAFSGYEMPVQYASGIIAEHNHTRTQAGLFDISHMGQIRVAGDAAGAGLEALIPTKLMDLPPFRQRYSVLTNNTGGIIDDLMVTNAGNHFFLVVNASCKQADFDYLKSRLGGQCELVELNNKALLALQGPMAVSVLARLAPGVDTMPFMSAKMIQIQSVECLISRCGYTGEDGYEISLPADLAECIARLLLDQPEVAPVGLGARDSLRLEAGLCLHGHDIDATTTLVEAGLSWVLAPEYRSGAEANPKFPGAAKIMAQYKQGPGRIRVGLKPQGRAPVREGTVILDENNEALGRVTSGGFGATVKGPIAMGYVDAARSEVGETLSVMLRNKVYPVTVTGLPFVEHRYFGKHSGEQSRGTL